MKRMHLLALAWTFVGISFSPAMADVDMSDAPNRIWEVCTSQAAAEKLLQSATEYTFDWDLGKSMRAKSRLIDSGDCKFVKGIAHGGHETVARRKTNYTNSEFVVAKYDENTFVLMEEKGIGNFHKLVSLCSSEEPAKKVAEAYARTYDAKVSASDYKAVSKGRCKAMELPTDEDFYEEDSSVKYAQYKYIKRSLHSTRCGSYEVGEMILDKKLFFSVVGISDDRHKKCD